MKSNLVFIMLALAIFVVGDFLIYKNGFVFMKADIIQKQKTGAENDSAKELAECLSAKNVKMYGADNCSACRAQKETLGEFLAYIDYIDCSQDGTNILSPSCRSEHIRGLPTWVFPANLRIKGELTLKEIAELSGCSGG